jgi:lipopolysaccharide transport system ATP-binding protein
LRDVLAAAPKRVWSRLSRKTLADPTREEFWAVQNLSFEIRQGEAVGIIGRNGAGKSTLLKLLSRITEPSTGRIEVDGRLASLLEVGTGFHPELTGRENVYLNGAILGMTRREIKSRFDEIVAFAEVERFLDTPVKRYSSGMYMRLAFAVAAHLEPEILVVDEVLAVGDMEFQKKCLGKMEDVSHGGRTVLFVSHNMDAILRLCSRVIHLAKGTVVDIGPTPAVVAKYLASQNEQSAVIEFQQTSPSDSLRRSAILLKAEWPSSETHSPWTIPYGDEISFVITVECREPIRAAELGVALYAPTGTEIASSTSILALPDLELSRGTHHFRVTYRGLKLVPHSYSFGVGLRSSFGMEDYYPKAFALDVVQSTESSITKVDGFLGYVVPDVDYALS